MGRENRENHSWRVKKLDIGCCLKRSSNLVLVVGAELIYRTCAERRRKGEKRKEELARVGKSGTLPRKTRRPDQSNASYTVHEKAQNFVVPIPFLDGWHDEQMDELFSSLLGGAGMKGASAETAVNAGGAIDTEGLADLGGLKVF